MNNSMNTWAILLAAGKSSRLAARGFLTPKQFLPLEGHPLFWRSAETLSRLAPLRGIVFVMPPFDAEAEAGAGVDADAVASVHMDTFRQYYEKQIRELEQNLPGKNLGIPWKIVPGGALRQESVYNGLRALPPECTAVLVHDSARPFATASLFMRVLEPVLAGGPAAIPGIAVSDTIKSVRQVPANEPHKGAVSPEGIEGGPELPGAAFVSQTHERASLRAVQTPQAFLLSPLLLAHERAAREGWEVTDDAALMEREGHPVLLVEGEESNRKITTPADLSLLEPAKEPFMSGRIPCTGFGYDVHRYDGNRPFILGGVPIACDVKIAAHSDGDTLLHALMDAMLGCIGGGDIGGLFPDSDPAFDNASSGMLLAEVLMRCLRQGLEIHHVDLTVIAQVPRIAPHRQNIAANVAKLLHMPPARVNVKATTEERLGFTGEKKGIKAVAVVTGSLPE